MREPNDWLTVNTRMLEVAPEMFALLRSAPLDSPDREQRIVWMTQADELIDYVLLGELTREGER